MCKFNFQGVTWFPCLKSLGREEPPRGQKIGPLCFCLFLYIFNIFQYIKNENNDNIVSQILCILKIYI